MNISDIQLFNALKEKLGTTEAEQMVTYVKGYINEQLADQVSNIATKDFVEAKVSFLESKIAESKFQITLWAFVFWATQLGAIFAFIKYLK